MTSTVQTVRRNASKPSRFGDWKDWSQWGNGWGCDWDDSNGRTTWDELGRISGWGSADAATAQSKYAQVLRREGREGREGRGANRDGRRRARSGSPSKNRRARPPASATMMVIRIFSASLVVLVVLRIVVLVSEAYAVVVNEREAEDELVRLCEQGKAGRSAHMRQACMGVAVDRAGFAIVRALHKGIYAFVRDAYAFLSSPFRAGAWMSVMGLMGVLPWLGPLKAMCSPTPVAVAPPPEQRVIVLHNGDRASSLTTASFRSNGIKYPPMLSEPASDDRIDELDINGDSDDDATNATDATRSNWRMDRV